MARASMSDMLEQATHRSQELDSLGYSDIRVGGSAGPAVPIAPCNDPVELTDALVDSIAGAVLPPEGAW
jgi:hypothetical protein